MLVEALQSPTVDFNGVPNVPCAYSVDGIETLAHDIDNLDGHGGECIRRSDGVHVNCGVGVEMALMVNK